VPSSGLPISSPLQLRITLPSGLQTSLTPDGKTILGTCSDVTYSARSRRRGDLKCSKNASWKAHKGCQSMRNLISCVDFRKNFVVSCTVSEDLGWISKAARQSGLYTFFYNLHFIVKIIRTVSIIQRDCYRCLKSGILVMDANPRRP
jgi:hypothetical protein